MLLAAVITEGEGADTVVVRSGWDVDSDVVDVDMPTLRFMLLKLLRLPLATEAAPDSNFTFSVFIKGLRWGFEREPTAVVLVEMDEDVGALILLTTDAGFPSDGLTTDGCCSFCSVL